MKGCLRKEKMQVVLSSTMFLILKRKGTLKLFCLFVCLFVLTFVTLNALYLTFCSFGSESR